MTTSVGFGPAVARLGALVAQPATLRAELDALAPTDDLSAADVDRIRAFFRPSVGDLERVGAAAYGRASVAATHDRRATDVGAVGAQLAAKVPKLVWTKFAADRHVPGTGRTSFDGTQAELLDLVAKHWHARKPGVGRSDLNEVVVVPVPPDRFRGASTTIKDHTQLTAVVTRRRAGEDPFVAVQAKGPPDPVRFATVVLYAKKLLEADGEKIDGAWGVVALTASDVEDEPMSPLTMARNMLGKPGGTKVDYTAQQFAEAVWYHSTRVQVAGDAA